MTEKIIFLLYIIVLSFSYPVYSQEESDAQAVDLEVQSGLAAQETEAQVLDQESQVEAASSETKVELTEEQLEQLAYYKSQALKALRKGEYPYSAAMFEKYLAVKDDDFKVNEYLSQVYMFTKEYAKAAVLLKKMTQIRPDYVTAYIHLGRLYRELGLFDESVATLEKALELRKNVETLFQLGLTYERFNKLEKARLIYEEVIYIVPVHAEAHFSLGLLYLRERDYERAQREIKRAVNLEPERQVYKTYLDKIDEYKTSEPDNETIEIEANPIMPDNG